MTTRREVVLFLPAAVMLPRVAIAQTKVFRVAWLSVDRAAAGSAFFDAFRDGMRSLGYTEGRNLAIDARWSDDSADHLPQLAAGLVKSAPQVIVAQGGQAIRALRGANATLPVVFVASGDPVESGAVDTLARPGRNMTGVSLLSLELVGKRMELLKETLPALRRVAIVANPEHPGEQGELRASAAAAKALGLAVDYFPARNASEIETALAAVAKTRSEAIVAFPDAIVMRNADRFVQFSFKTRVPAVSGWAQFADRGNLAAYGPNLRDVYGRIAVYVDKILKGARPAEIPVELPTSVELVLNVKTARALGVTVPQSVLLRANRVIE